MPMPYVSNMANTNAVASGVPNVESCCQSIDSSAEMNTLCKDGSSCHLLHMVVIDTDAVFAWSGELRQPANAESAFKTRLISDVWRPPTNS